MKEMDLIQETNSAQMDLAFLFNLIKSSALVSLWCKHVE